MPSNDQIRYYLHSDQILRQLTLWYPVDYEQPHWLRSTLDCKRQLLGVLMRRTKAVRLWLDSKVEALLCLLTSLRMVAY